jgi:hypothetical protein
MYQELELLTLRLPVKTFLPHIFSVQKFSKAASFNLRELISSDQLKSQASCRSVLLFLYPLNNLWLSDVHIFNTNVLAIYSI